MWCQWATFCTCRATGSTTLWAKTDPFSATHGKFALVLPCRRMWWMLWWFHVNKICSKLCNFLNACDHFGINIACLSFLQPVTKFFALSPGLGTHIKDGKTSLHVDSTTTRSVYSVCFTLLSIVHCSYSITYFLLLYSLNLTDQDQAQQRDARRERCSPGAWEFSTRHKCRVLSVLNLCQFKWKFGIFFAK